MKIKFSYVALVDKLPDVMVLHFSLKLIFAHEPIIPLKFSQFQDDVVGLGDGDADALDEKCNEFRRHGQAGPFFHLTASQGETQMNFDGLKQQTLIIPLALFPKSYEQQTTTCNMKGSKKTLNRSINQSINGRIVQITTQWMKSYKWSHTI